MIVTTFEEDFQPLYNFSVSVSPSNRIQLKINPQLIKRKRSTSSSGGRSFSSFHILTPTLPDGEAGRDLASLPNCDEQSGLADVPGEKIKNNDGIPVLPRAKKFTRLARKTILDAAGALEKDGIPFDNFYFFTGTLPGSSPAACEYFARYSRLFLDAIKSYLRKLGLNLTFNCWEWQLRKKANLVPALHLHLVVVCKDEKLGYRLPEILKTTWFRLLDHYSRTSGVDFYEKHQKLGGGRWTHEELDKLAAREKNPLETCKTVRCQKSPAAYLSKYVGKGSLAGDEDFQERFKKGNVPLYYPSSWWSVSKEIKKIINKHTCIYGFRNTFDKCKDAYDSMCAILEDKELGLLALSLPAFIPEWGFGKRIYRNMYCKSEEWEAIKELARAYNHDSENYESRYFQKIDSYQDTVIKWFEAPANCFKRDELIYSLPSYCCKNGSLDWTNPLVMTRAIQILEENSNFQYEPKSLEQRIEQQNNVSSFSELRKLQIHHSKFAKFMFSEMLQEIESDILRLKKIS